MGSREMWVEDCPKCKTKDAVEGYSHPSALFYFAYCKKCDYVENLDYYETDKDTIELLTKKQAKKRGLR